MWSWKRYVPKERRLEKAPYIGLFLSFIKKKLIDVKQKR